VDRLAAPFVGSSVTGDAKEPAVANAASAVALVASAEGNLVRTAARVLAASEQDADRFADLYGRERSTIEYIPNGASLPDDPWLEPERRARLKATLGFDDRPVALFVGSNHGPNHDAADLLVAAARGRPNWVFWVAGSICNYEGLGKIPSHVYPLGLVSEAELTALFRAADVGLNPMLRGAGTNLKMLDYAAHGTLVLSTEIGARGLGFVAGTHYISFPPDGLAAALELLERELPSPRLPVRTAARKLVEERFSWLMIADRILAPARGPGSPRRASDPCPTV
jgi:glycosyltransferase involved in cell wall biosynthesis